MTNDVDAIEARANAATPGPWQHHWHPDGLGIWIQPKGEDSFSIGPNDNDENNAAFIAAARQDVPALCAEVRELRAALAFYANHNHWMAIREDADKQLLVAHGPHFNGTSDGWVEAEAALKGKMK